MIAKAILGSLVALAVASVACDRAQAQYYQQQYSPYQQQQYYQPQQQPYYQYQQQQYAPTQQYAPAQSQYYQQQYAPAPAQPYQQQYAPPSTAYTQTPALPDYCMQNNAAAGALAGGAAGSLIGGLAGGGRGALIGGLTGAMFGGMSGAQADTQCQQIAAQIAYQQAAAQQAAIEAQIAQQAARQNGVLTLPASAYVPVSTDYQTPSNGHRHRITVKRLNSYSEPAARRICDNFTKIDADLDQNTSSATNSRRCKGPDGQWRDAA
jgi:hypothetical protein